MNETTVPMRSTIQRSEFMTTCAVATPAIPAALLVCNLLQQIPPRGSDHGRNGKQKTELERRGAVEADYLAGGDG